jgi:hypothetical protein
VQQQQELPAHVQLRHLQLLAPQQQQQQQQLLLPPAAGAAALP